MGGVEYQVTKVDPTDPHTKGAVYQVHKVSEEVAATLGGKVYRARIINDPTAPTVAGKVYQIVLIDDPEDPAVKGKVYNAILTGGSEAVVVGPAVSPLSLPDAIANSLSYVKAFGGTEQNGTPTPDTPVDIVSNNGVLKYTPNLLDMSAENIVLGKYINNSGAVLDSGPNFYNSKYIPVVASGTYTWSTSSSISYFSVMEYGSDYAFKKRTLFSNAGTSGSITLRSDTAFVLVGSNMDSTDVTLDKIAAVDWQFEKGSSATAYKPYSSTGIYTDGTVETINVHGKNLFDQSTATRYRTSWSNSGGGAWQATSSSSEAVTYGSYVKPNTTYTLSKKGGSRLIITGYRTKTEPSSSATPADYQIQTSTTEVVDGSYTFTTPADCTWILFGLRQNNTTYIFPYDIQLEQGSTATEYVPYYDGGTATAEMLLKVGDYQDEQEILSGAITRNVGIVILDGTENWSLGTVFSVDNVAQKAVFPSTSMSTHFVGNENSISPNMFRNNSFKVGASGYRNRIYIKATQYADETELKAFLAQQYANGTPVIIVYPLATPTTESVAGQALQVTDGDNTLEITQASLTGLELEAEYEKEAV